MNWLSLSISLLLVASSFGAKPCNPKDYAKGIVCVCNSQYCDAIDKIEAEPSGTFTVYTSDKDGKRFEKTAGTFSRDNDDDEQAETVTIDHSIEYQTIQGFGGAFTDAAGINIDSLNAEARHLLLKSYFGEDGLEYNYGRVPIGGTDFSTHAYSLDDGDEDATLENFQLAPEDHEFKIPYIKMANDLNNELKLFASAWTAPKWLKSSGEYTSGSIKGDRYQVWADYHLKFLQAYGKEGLDFWGISTGNEPSLALVPSTGINSVGWSADNMTIYVAENLGPTIKNAYPDLKILCIDDQRLFLPWWPKQIVLNTTAGQYIDGVAVHWYWDNIISPEALDQTHDALPDKFLLATESCRGDKSWEEPVSLGDWSRAEDYASGILEDLNHWVTGWIDWNLALNETGGPCYIGNEVDAPIIVNATAQEFYKQPVYYALGHFSKFLPEGSVRIHRESDGSLEVVALQRPDNGTVVIILNSARTSKEIEIKDDVSGTIKATITPKSISTFIYW